MWQVVGQPKAVNMLERSLEDGHLAHAYLFVGPPHVGKMTLALNLAQALNCEQAERPCGRCPSCRRIASGNHADIQVIGRVPGEDSEGLSKAIGIDQIREMQRATSLRPYEGKYRVFIIDGAERMTPEAANCLLKTLEEPPPGVMLILSAVDEGLLLPTVISRCHRVALSPVPASAVEQALVERWQVAPERADILSRLCHGGIGWAVSAAADPAMLQERSQRLEKLIGLADNALEQRFSYAAQLAAQFSKNRGSVEEVLQLWLGWWRDLLLVQGGGSQFITNIDCQMKLQHQARDWSLAQSRGFIEAIQQAQEQLEQNANPRLVLEVLMLSIPIRKRKHG